MSSPQACKLRKALRLRYKEIAGMDFHLDCDLTPGGGGGGGGVSSAGSDNDGAGGGGGGGARRGRVLSSETVASGGGGAFESGDDYDEASRDDRQCVCRMTHEDLVSQQRLR